MIAPMATVPPRLSVAASPGGWTLSGEIDAHSAPALEEATSELPDAADPIRVDVSEVSFIDSSGLRVLIALATRANDEGRSVVLDNPSGAVTRLLEITALGDMFGLAGKPTDA